MRRQRGTQASIALKFTGPWAPRIIPAPGPVKQRAVPAQNSLGQFAAGPLRRERGIDHLHFGPAGQKRPNQRVRSGLDDLDSVDLARASPGGYAALSRSQVDEPVVEISSTQLARTPPALTVDENGHPLPHSSLDGGSESTPAGHPAVPPAVAGPRPSPPGRQSQPRWSPAGEST